MKWAQITDKGLTREFNEDNLLITPEIGALAVADGMGGHQGGRIASKLALKTFEQELTRMLRHAGEFPKVLQDAVKMANSAVYAHAYEKPELKGMGTTITACVQHDRQLFIAHVGDSRAYLLRQGNIRQMTRDHSLVQELMQKDVINEEQARSHPQRHLLTRALGAEPFVEVDNYQINLLPGDQLLLCTDGLTRYLQPPELLEVLMQGMDPERSLEALLNKALKAGGADNITMVLACF
ncbi:MAG: Stp1/IreP family PP2C-type Ser/Thr phosphatase [Peptococcaceae bacterium]|nr:Stp1/IreP family PP2C-type Ser/Thr phosphatase [Peptococcaceae bacterium]